MKSIIDKIYNKIFVENIENEKEYFLFHRNRYEFILDIVKKLKITERESLLDIGSHFLHILLSIKELNYDTYGIDIELFVKLTESRAKTAGIILRECDLAIDKVPFEDNFFNVVFCNETLEHLNFHPLKVFKEIQRVLKPGGRVLITTPNLTRLNNRIKFLLGKSIYHNIREDYWAGTHYREYSKNELVYLIKEAGLKVKEIIFINFDYPDTNFIVKIVNKLMGLLFPFLRGNIVIIGEK